MIPEKPTKRVQDIPELIVSEPEVVSKPQVVSAALVLSAAPVVSEATVVSVAPVVADVLSMRLSAAEAELPIGTIFAGKYEILDKLGAGGMGTVYLARDPALSRKVAVKVLFQRYVQDNKALARFQQEARAAGGLSHIGIVRVHEFAVCDGQPYLVMDYVAGKPLSDLIKTEGNLPIEPCLSIASQAAEALDCAHRNGVVHRDLKPGNIMLVAKDTNNTDSWVRIVDFGIAKIATAEGQALTQTGEIFGSPLYMSPEQCSGSKIDQRSDVYSLACVMYEMLTGHPPHRGDSALSTAIKHLHDAPATLSAARPDLSFSHELEAIIAKALAKDGNDRYQSMADLRSDILLVAGQQLEPQSNRAVSRTPAQRRLNFLFFLPGWLALFLIGTVPQANNEIMQIVNRLAMACLGFDLIALSFVFAAPRNKKGATLSQIIASEIDATVTSAAHVTVKTTRTIFLVFVAQIVLLSLGHIWAAHPEWFPEAMQLADEHADSDLGRVAAQAAEYMNSKQYEKAIPLWQLLIRAQRQEPQNRYLLADKYAQIGKCYKELGRFKQSAPFYDYALKSFIEHPGFIMDSTVRRDYAEVLTHLGENGLAEKVVLRTYHPQPAVDPVPDLPH